MVRATKSSADWAQIRAAFIQENESVRALSRRYNVSETAIRKRAKADHWPVRTGANCEPDCEPKCEPSRKPRASVDFSRLRAPAVGSRTPVDLNDAVRRNLEFLVQEIELYSSNVDLIREIIAEETAGDRSPKRRLLLERITSLPGRTQALKNATAALSVVSNREAPVGKKEHAQREAELAGAGSDWGDLLLAPFNGAPRRNDS